jgi:hypothetical protein
VVSPVGAMVASHSTLTAIRQPCTEQHERGNASR